MSTAPAFIVHDGKLDNTENLQETLGLTEGAKLFVVSSNDRHIVLRREPVQNPAQLHGLGRLSHEEYMAGWDRLRGIMKDGIDTAEERAREKLEERDRELRKWGE